jgi:hypothetical protein
LKIVWLVIGVFAVLCLIVWAVFKVAAVHDTQVTRESLAAYAPQAKLTATDGKAGDYFGEGVAVSGDTVIAADSSASAAYVFVRSGTTWTQQAKLTTTDGTIGHQVAISGDTAAVCGTDASGNQIVFIYTRNGTAWSQQGILNPLEANPLHTVAIYGDTVLAGGQDAAFVFTRSGNIWHLQAKLTSTQSTLGGPVSLYGDTGVVCGTDYSGTGIAFVFTRADTTWTQQAMLSAPNGLGVFTAAISADTVLAGGNDFALVFTREGTTWTQQTKLTQLYGIADADLGPDNLAGMLHGAFGRSVAISGDTAIISGGASIGGSVFVFTRGGTTWTQQHKLLVADLRDGDHFGISICVDKDTAVIGFPGYNTTGFSAITGAAYVFGVNSDK